MNAPNRVGRIDGGAVGYGFGDDGRTPRITLDLYGSEGNVLTPLQARALAALLTVAADECDRAPLRF